MEFKSFEEKKNWCIEMYNKGWEPETVVEERCFLSDWSFKEYNYFVLTYPNKVSKSEPP